MSVTDTLLVPTMIAGLVDRLERCRRDLLDEALSDLPGHPPGGYRRLRRHKPAPVVV